MPKIIKDVEKTIKNSAIDLFIELGYINVDMRMISKKSGVAVGTLYNYFQNKKQLYINILKESWQDTFNELDIINELTISTEEKLTKFLSTLYEDVEARNGLGKFLINTSVDELKDDIEIINLKNSLISRVENFFKCFNTAESLNKCFKIETRLAEALLASTLIMLELHPKDKKENINFLVGFMSLSMR
ncbi:TetR/AcrR family transcriptional regulator [Candidatus Clostridium stratigraminis]|uniref:TetR/AcrR family transcriptional regulator n=1 Tax=Candidatus Clostridium stratigraminis TaxID=3381661 RepID=A0ABW8SZ01_9CLOT